ncbi:unnamed protein product [Lactuca saligna]|uniref:Glycosyltransferase n=1 Tax=Lactuca saligna TaxID=75948 RepID=A0AA35ZBH8_LACSI|nr:unnamed protein product [Lactuca saligna]
MASEPTSELHFLFIPFLAPGHTIPMIDMAKLLAQQPNITVTVVTTPLNAVRYSPILNNPGGFPSTSVSSHGGRITRWMRKSRRTTSIQLEYNRLNIVFDKSKTQTE